MNIREVCCRAEVVHKMVRVRKTRHFGSNAEKLWSSDWYVSIRDVADGRDSYGRRIAEHDWKKSPRKFLQLSEAASHNHHANSIQLCYSKFYFI